MTEEKGLPENTNQNNSQNQPNNENGKLVAILAYLLVGIVWFFADENLKKDENAKFHVKQALVLLIVSIGGSIVLSLIPIISWILLPFFGLGTCALGIIGIINAANGHRKELPFIGAYARKLKF